MPTRTSSTPTFARRLMMALTVSVTLSCVLSSCASSKGRSGGGSGDGEEAGEIPTVDDVVRIELRRSPARDLERALSDEAPEEVRARAALALARLEHVEAAPLLFRAAKDESAGVRRHAAFGLGQLDLGLVAGRPVHDEMRSGLETFLAGWQDRESNDAVRLAIVRALGRVSMKEGLQHLLKLAESGVDRTAALYALGVAGARRASSLAADPKMLSVVVAGLSHSDAQVRRAAAYAAFRQKAPLPDEVLARAAKEPDAAARIHLARLMNETLRAPTHALPLLDDGDWRVRVEAVRALAAQAARGGALPTSALRSLGEGAAKRLVAKEGASADGHVVAAVCDALGEPSLPVPPDDVLPSVAAISAVLSSSSSEQLDAIRCRCAVAQDALGSRTEAVRSCAPSWSADRVRVLEVQVAAKARLSSRERVAWLAKALSDHAVPVRVQAAWVLVEDASKHAARLAASRLDQEEDPAVAAALLSLFEGDNAEEVSDVTLARVVDRFYGASTLEEAEPLWQAAKLLEGRTSPQGSDAAARLRAHSEPRLRESVDGVPHGERLSGPRAAVVTAAAPKDLPLAAILKTERGDIHLAFDREAAPVTVENFVALARRGFYDGVVFHRVVSNFVTQGGDPRGDGSGGPGHHIPCENSDGSYERGVVGMALSGKDTGGSQFFLTHSEQPHLDGRYTIFARVTSGLEVMDSLMPDDRILSVHFAGAVPAREAAR